MVVEVLLLILYLGLVIFVFDTSKVSGLILVGVATLVIFPFVLFLEKRREGMGGGENGASSEEAEPEAVPSAPSAEQAPSSASPPEQQPASPEPAQQPTAENQPPL